MGQDNSVYEQDLELIRAETLKLIRDTRVPLFLCANGLHEYVSSSSLQILSKRIRAVQEKARKNPLCKREEYSDRLESFVYLEGVISGLVENNLEQALTREIEEHFGTEYRIYCDDSLFN